jgi:hypothetical protein
MLVIGLLTYTTSKSFISWLANAEFVSFSSTPGLPPPRHELQQEAPHQEPIEGGFATRTGAALKKVKKDGTVNAALRGVKLLIVSGHDNLVT